MKTPLYNTDTLEHILHTGNHDTVTWLSSISGLAHIVLQQADNLTDEQRDWVCLAPLSRPRIRENKYTFFAQRLCLAAVGRGGLAWRSPCRSRPSQDHPLPNCPGFVARS
jgi:hypothetical protein